MFLLVTLLVISLSTAELSSHIYHWKIPVEQNVNILKRCDNSLLPLNPKRIVNVHFFQETCDFPVLRLWSLPLPIPNIHEFYVTLSP